MIEAVLVALEDPPWHVMYRVVIGFSILAAYLFVDNRYQTECSLTAVFFLSLAALRIGLASVRRLVPVSEHARNIWATRRGLGKLYDSYQWRKLLGLGIGLVVFQGFARWTNLEAILLSLFCLLGGGLGEFFWSRAVRARAS